MHHAPGPRLPGAIGEHGCATEGNDWPARGHSPGHQLNRYMRRIDPIELVICGLECAHDACAIMVGAWIRIKGDRELALLAEIAQIGTEDKSGGPGVASGRGKRSRGLAHQLAQESIDALPVEVAHAYEI